MFADSSFILVKIRIEYVDYLFDFFEFAFDYLFDYYMQMHIHMLDDLEILEHRLLQEVNII